MHNAHKINTHFKVNNFSRLFLSPLLAAAAGWDYSSTNFRPPSSFASLVARVDSCRAVSCRVVTHLWHSQSRRNPICFYLLLNDDDHLLLLLLLFNKNTNKKWINHRANRVNPLAAWPIAFPICLWPEILSASIVVATGAAVSSSSWFDLKRLKVSTMSCTISAAQ